MRQHHNGQYLQDPYQNIKRNLGYHLIKAHSRNHRCYDSA